ncbi:hypothetical protein BaRGS_00012976, partial [Batillaria attramentaria]
EFTDQDQFLKVIQPQFLRLAHPIESGVVDELRREEILSSDDQDELASETSRRDKARLLWSKLHRVPPKTFGEKCVPLLRRTYPHMFPTVTFRWNGQKQEEEKVVCLRHVLMKRQSPKKLMDVVKLASGKYDGGKRQWATAFRLLHKNCKSPSVRVEMLKLFKKIGVDNPTGLRKQIRSGFPCTCKPTAQLPRSGKHDKIRKEATVTPSSSSQQDMTCGTDSSVESISNTPPTDSSSTGQTDCWVPSPDNCQPPPFRSRADKKKYQAVLGSVNQGITAFEGIRLECRKLERARDELSTLLQIANDEQSLCNDDAAEAEVLQEKAKKSAEAIDVLQKSASAALQETDELFEKTHSQIPDAHMEYLVSRRHLLVSYSKETLHFVNKASKVFGQVQKQVEDSRMRNLLASGCRPNKDTENSKKHVDVPELFWLRGGKMPSQETFRKPSTAVPKLWASQP